MPSLSASPRVGELDMRGSAGLCLQVDRRMHVATGSAGEAQQECLQSSGPLQRGHSLRRLPLPVPRESPPLGRRGGA